MTSGLVFDAAEQTWRPTAPAPLEPRALMASAWTGSELLVWGGWSGKYGYEFAEAFLGDGAAYDPATARGGCQPRPCYTPLGRHLPFGEPMRLSCPGRSAGS